MTQYQSIITLEPGGDQHDAVLGRETLGTRFDHESFFVTGETSSVEQNRDDGASCHGKFPLRPFSK